MCHHGRDHDTVWEDLANEDPERDVRLEDDLEEPSAPTPTLDD